MWPKNSIVEDLKALAAQGAEPDIFQLKERYGYALSSEFFPLLNAIGTERVELKEFVAGIFNRVKDPRDLLFVWPL